jgi:hypothetical protein
MQIKISKISINYPFGKHNTFRLFNHPKYNLQELFYFSKFVLCINHNIKDRKGI